MDYSGAINEMDSPLPISLNRLPMPRSNSAMHSSENMMPADIRFPKNITPDMDAPAQSSLSGHQMWTSAPESGISRVNQPPPVSASFFRASATLQHAASDSQKHRPLKNDDALNSHDTSQRLSPGEDTTYESPTRKIPSIISTRVDPSPLSMISPMVGGMASGKSPNKKRAMEGRSEFCIHDEDQPHTPKYRCLLQGLSLNSPVRSSTSSTPEERGGSIQKTPYRRPPNIPSFMKKKLESITLTESFETQSFSAANTPIRTPETGQFFNKSTEKISTPTTASSSFHSVRTNRTSIGHQNSPFKLLPPRLNDQPQGSSAQSSPFLSSPTRYASSSPYATSPTRYDSSPTRLSFSSPLISSSPSPRVVPLKVLSRDGSPMDNVSLASHVGSIPTLGKNNLPYDPSMLSSPAVVSSPLMKSLDQFAKKEVDEDKDKDSTGVLSNSIMSRSPKPSEDYPQLPRIKLTPRSKINHASLMLDASPRGETLPPLSVLGVSGSVLKRKSETSGDEEAAEMDSLLNGFGHPNADDEEPSNEKQCLNEVALGRVESEESEMVAIARTPLFLPSFTAKAKVQNVASETKPMKSIMFKTQNDQKESTGSPSCLPRFRFTPVTKSRSLFNSPRVDDPVEQLIRADAIAEAAKSNEELTDDESESDGLESDFLLCMPKDHDHAPKMLHKLEKRPTRAAKLPLKPSHRAESPSFSRTRASNIGGLKPRTRSFSNPKTPTIAEEGLTSFDAAFSKSTTSNENAHQGFSQRDESAATQSSFCSLSDFDETTSNHIQSHQMPTSIDIGMKSTGLSMSSLCGLDIVDESVDEFRDKVPASLPSKSSQGFKQSECSDTGIVGLRRSEFSQNSLGLSVDSAGDVDQRDLFTPPLATVRSLQSPPPLPIRVVHYQVL